MWPNVGAMSNKRRTLVLLRHAKSAYPFGVADHERPLASRGQREAGLAGKWLRSGNVDPIEGVLCSTATRTRQTLMEMGIGAPVQYSDRLYCATPPVVIDEINQVADGFTADVRSLLVIAHEPAMSQLTLALTGAEGSNETAAANVATKFPTSAIAVLRFDGPWQKLAPGEAALLTFHVPR